METYLFWIVPIASLLALVLAWYFYKQMMLESEGTPTMEKIASYVRQGLSETTIQGGRAGISGISYSVFYHGIRLQLTKSVGAHCFSYRRFLLRTVRLFRNENGYIRFCTYRQCRPTLPEQRTACSFP